MSDKFELGEFDDQDYIDIDLESITGALIKKLGGAVELFESDLMFDENEKDIIIFQQEGSDGITFALGVYDPENNES